MICIIILAVTVCFFAMGVDLLLSAISVVFEESSAVKNEGVIVHISQFCRKFLLCYCA